jgi:multidrug efflux pump subunit AcrB
MTTITTVLGMFPLALGIGDGAEFLQPLGIVVFSGLALATLLTLFIIPCVYVLVYSFFGKANS